MYFKHVGCRVTHSLAQSIPVGLTVALQFDTQRFDTGNMHSTTVNNSRITFNLRGYYTVGGNIRFNPVPDDTRRNVGIRINNTFTILEQEEVVADGGGITSFQSILNLSGIYFFRQNDFIELEVAHSASTPQTVSVSSQMSPEFWAQRVA